MKQQYMRDIFDFVNTAAGKVVAVLVAFALTLTLSSLAHAVDGAIQAAGAEASAAAEGANTSDASGDASEAADDEIIEISDAAPGETPESVDETSEGAGAAEKDIDETIKDAVTQDAPATEGPAIQVDEASVSISTENCAVEIGGAALVGGTATVPLHTPLTFSIVPDSAFVVESVYINAAGLPIPWVLGADDLPFTIPAEYVDSNLSIAATAVLFDPSNPPEDPTPDPIEDETELVPDGFYDAPTLSIGNMNSMYTGAVQDLYNDDFDATVEGLQDGDELIISGYDISTEEAGKVAGKDAGTHTVAVTSYWIKRATKDNRDVTREYQPIDLSGVTATLTINKAPLYIVSPSASKAFDGTPLTYAGEGGQYDFLDIEWLMENGMLASYDGPAALYTLFDYFEGEYMWVTGSQTSVGTSPNHVEIRADVLEELDKNYDLEYRLGTLRVTTEDVVIYAPTASKIYDGRPLSVSAEDLYWDNLPAGFTVEARILNASRTEVGRQVTSIDPESVRIFDADGNDVTSTYEGAITLANGELAVDRLITRGETTGGNGNTTGGNGGNGGSNGGNGGSTTPAPGGPTYVAPATTVGAPAVSPATDANDAGTEAGAAENSESEESADGINETVAAVAQGMQNAKQFLNGEEITDLTAPATEETLGDDETPLGVFDKPIDCWVHWYTILGLLATAIYGGVVMFFRRAYAYELESREANILGAPVGMAQPHLPAGTSGHAGREA